MRRRGRSATLRPKAVNPRAGVTLLCNRFGFWARGGLGQQRAAGGGEGAARLRRSSAVWAALRKARTGFAMRRRASAQALIGFRSDQVAGSMPCFLTSPRDALWCSHDQAQASHRYPDLPRGP